MGCKLLGKDYNFHILKVAHGKYMRGGGRGSSCKG